MDRRTPLRRTGPPARRSELKDGPAPTRHTALARRTPLKAESDRRRDERPDRAAVNALVAHRDGGCVWHVMSAAAHGPVRCVGRLAAHEILKRSRGGCHLDPANCVALCSWANGWVEDEPHAAETIGLAIPSANTFPTLDPDAAATEAALIRARRRHPLRTAWAVPSWRAGDDDFAAAARRGLTRAGWRL